MKEEPGSLTDRGRDGEREKKREIGTRLSETFREIGLAFCSLRAGPPWFYKIERSCRKTEHAVIQGGHYSTDDRTHGYTDK